MISLNEIFKQLDRFRARIYRTVQPAVRPISNLQESATEVPAGSINSGYTASSPQTTYEESTGKTKHIFMLDVDGLDSNEAPLG